MTTRGIDDARSTRLLALSMLFLSACGGLGNDEPEVPSPTWTGEVQALLQTRCASCHTAPPQNGAPDEFRLDRFDREEAGGAVDGAYDKRDRIRIRAVIEGSMPFGGPPLPESERALLRRWIDGGAPRSLIEARPRAFGLEP